MTGCENTINQLLEVIILPKRLIGKLNSHFCEDYTQARKIELYIKKMKSRKYIIVLLEDKTESEKLLMKFKTVPQKKNNLVWQRSQ